MPSLLARWRRGVPAQPDAALSGGSPDWLDDFLNHLGQDEALWNPNAGIRVRPTIAGINPSASPLV